jgi:phenylalanyl-tRNA synthetase beta chain
MTVVCGAPNVAGGQKIAFAHEGARLFSTRSGKVEPLKSARIRGVLSSGMVCSPLELGLSEDHEGILVLEDDAPVGTPLVDYLGDAVLDIEVTPNRPDCLAILGVAHEAAALTGQTVTEPDLSYAENGQPIEDQVSVEIADPELCYRYTASLVTGVKIGPSPRWMQDALVKAGQRPINSIVDITNYVMLEYGQPLHAFDFDGVKKRTIIVRAARAGEVLVTLDGERRALEPPMLAIADAEDAIGLAGVMGGASTEMHDGTTSVFLESANFDPVNTRRTASALRIATEASHRFERGVRAELAPLALRRATQLILEIAGGEAAQGIIDLYPGEKDRPAVKISLERIKKVLGVDYEMSQVEGVLGSLGFERSGESEAEDAILVKVPYWRSDISIEDDLIEEVARITGYDNIPTTTLSTPIPHHEPQTERGLREQVRDLLAAAGMQEIISYNLTSLESLRAVEALDDVAEPLRVTNPMSGEQDYLRTSLRGAVLSTLASNRKTIGTEGIRIFELGRVFLPRDEAGERDLPEEKEMLAGVLSGPRFVPSWRVPSGEMDFFDAKGVLESVFSALGLRVEYERAGDAILHPGKTARLSCGGTAIGVVGEVHPTVRARFDLGQSPVALFEIDIESLTNAMSEADRSYRSTSRFPQSHRDLALIVDQDVPSAGIQAIIEAHGLVVGSAPFDVYSGEGVPEGKKSVAYAVTFQSAEGTLTSEQVDQAQDNILRRLEREVGATLRG